MLSLKGLTIRVICDSHEGVLSRLFSSSDITEQCTPSLMLLKRVLEGRSCQGNAALFSGSVFYREANMSDRPDQRSQERTTKSFNCTTVIEGVQGRDEKSEYILR
jgi:hypothetical protein